MEARTLVAVLFVGAAGCGAPAAAPVVASAPPVRKPVVQPPTSLEETARACADDIASHREAAAAARFEPGMRRKVPPAALAELMAGVEAELGAYAGVDGIKATRVGERESVRATLKYARGRQALRFVFDADRRVAGLWADPVTEDLEPAARATIEALRRGDFAGAAAAFGNKLRADFPVNEISAKWGELTAKLGKVEDVEGYVALRDPRAWSVVANTRFAKAKIGLQLDFDMHGRVSGFFVTEPAVAQQTWQPPPYVDAAKIEERPISIGDKPALPGALTLPKGGRDLPVVVLVHGSGPGDRDESSARNRANRMFKDIAWGLASRGVAVVRYDKRTRVEPDGVVTVEQEYVDAVRAAIAFVKATPELDARRVVVLGHSQGGSLAPRFAREVAGIAGLAILAGPARSFQDSMVMQMTYFAKIYPGAPGLAEEIARAKALKSTVEDPLLRADQPVKSSGGMTGAYFLDLRNYDALRVAAALPQPMLILQGDRDYQVPVDEFEQWRKALAGRPKVKTKKYPGLNHMFMPGTGVPRPEEYATTNHVAADVVEDLAAFVSTVR